MFDPETIVMPLMQELEEAIAKMRATSSIDEKLKWSSHVKNLSNTFGDFVTTATGVMDSDYDEYDDDLDNFDDDDEI